MVILRILAFGVLLLQCPQAEAADDITVFRGGTMGTSYTIRVLLPQQLNAKSVSVAIDQRLVNVNQQMSHYIASSEISAFNRGAEPGEWFEVSLPFASVAEYALEVAKASDGAFDPTVGPLVNLWGFGHEDRSHIPPTDEEIDAALQVVGYEKIEVRRTPPAIKKRVAGVELNLSALAKGYGVDAVCEVLDSYDCKAYMVEIGGEVRTRGTKPGGVPWQIGIEAVVKDKESDSQPTSKILALTDEALATSGDYRNYWEHEGRRYSHTINPKTGRPVEHTLATVTVRDETCMRADALATVILALGPDAGLEWAEQNKVSATLVDRSEDKFQEQATTYWEADEANATQATIIPTKKDKSMWGYFLITAFVFAIAIAGMAVGVILSNRRLRGSCGGLSNMKDKTGNPACELCSNPSPSCSGNPDDREVAASEA